MQNFMNWFTSIPSINDKMVEPIEPNKGLNEPSEPFEPRRTKRTRTESLVDHI